MQSQKSWAIGAARWCRRFCLILAVLTAAGCASLARPPARPQIPASLATHCQDLPPFDSYSWHDLAQAYIDLAYLYQECAAMHEALLDALSE